MNKLDNTIHGSRVRRSSCNECLNNKDDVLLEIGSEESGYETLYICKGCLKKALEMLDEKKECLLCHKEIKADLWAKGHRFCSDTCNAKWT